MKMTICLRSTRAALTRTSALPTAACPVCGCCPSPRFPRSFFFFFNDTAPTEIYTLSLHDALPICFSIVDQGFRLSERLSAQKSLPSGAPRRAAAASMAVTRSEEHTSELQSHVNLVCRLLLEKKKQK